jgi:hypothetical protein
MSQPDKPHKDQLRPVWFFLPPRFFRRVRRIAKECAIQPEEVVSRGVTLFVLEHRKKKKVEATACSRAAATLVSKRWASTTAAERRELARELANRRWSGKKKPQVDE